jgi:hypothetical protein
MSLGSCVCLMDIEEKGFPSIVVSHYHLYVNVSMCMDVVFPSIDCFSLFRC